MVSEKAVRQSIYQKLNVSSVTGLLGSGSASLVHAVARPTSAYPLCVFNKQSGVTDSLTFSGDHMDNELWLVKGIAKGTSASVAEDIDKACFDLLHFGALSITGAEDLFLSRESDVSFPETQGDTVFFHVGGLYRLRYQDS